MTGQVLQFPELRRYEHVAAVLEGIAELAARGRLVFPAEPVPIVIDFNEGSHRYKIDGEFVPGVTGILDETEVAPALQWWAFRVGLAFAIRAVQEGMLSLGQLQAWSWEPVIKPADWLAKGHPDVTLTTPKKGPGKAKHLIEHMAMKLRHHPNAIKEDRGTVGTSIHVAAEHVGITGEVPDIGDFPEADRGYVQALARYWIAQEPEVEQQEVIVGSKRFGYAGRFDKIARLPNGQRRLRDYKTSSGVYPKFDKQISLYDLAYREMGGEPLDGHDVVHLRPDGNYSVIPVTVDHMDGLVALLALLQGRNLKERVKALGREV